MTLHITSVSSHLSVSNSRSRVSGHYFFGNKIDPNILIGNQVLFHNNPIHVEVSMLKHVALAVSEFEMAGYFINVKLVIPERIFLL